ncbi:MAG: phosphoribosylglycinamide formyltransferase [Bacillota bacterium]|nr:phosphoribosylglycinamide formyltransferase [Bacillota bacterium]
MVNIAVLVSGGGTNLQALIDAEKRGEIKNGHITLVVSNKAGVFALKRAEDAGIKTEVILPKDFATKDSYCDNLADILKQNDIGLVVLAGFLVVLTSKFVSLFHNSIINVHPSLIPSFCGDGYYGLRVHKAALERGVKVTGATVHFVNEITDGGSIILQKAVNVFDGDTPETLQRRVMEEAEWQLLPAAVSMFCDGKLNVEDK